MASGLLTGAMTRERIATLPDDDSRRNYDHFQEPELSRNLALADLLSGIGKRYACGAAQVAVGWALSSAGVTGAIVGIRSARQVEGIVGAASLLLDENDVAEIEAFLADYQPQPLTPANSLQDALRRFLTQRLSGTPFHLGH